MTFRNLYKIPFIFFQVSDLIGKFPDLMDEFSQFFERCESIGIQNTYFDFLVHISNLLSDCHPLLQMDFNTLLVL